MYQEHVNFLAAGAGSSSSEVSLNRLAAARVERRPRHTASPLHFTLTVHHGRQRWLFGPASTPVSNSTRRFMLLNSLLESQRTSCFALSAVQHSYCVIPPPAIAENVPAATADDGPGRGVAIVANAAAVMHIPLFCDPLEAHARAAWPRCPKTPHLWTLPRN